MRRQSPGSETLDVLLRELIAAQKQRAIESAYIDYYDSLPAEEIEEQRAWGAFTESQWNLRTRCRVEKSL